MQRIQPFLPALCQASLANDASPFETEPDNAVSLFTAYLTGLPARAKTCQGQQADEVT